MSKLFFGPGFDRRSFLRGSAAAATASMVLGRSARALSKDDPDALRVGIVGCGGRGTGAAMQALCAEEGSVVLTAMGDVFQDRLEESHKNLEAGLRERFGEAGVSRLQVDPEHRFVGFDAWQKVLASDVDVVLLTTPPHFRPQMLEAAVRAGKHVFCEKPMAVDGPGVRRVLATVEEARQKKLSIVAGFCWRYNVRHRELYQRIHDGALGPLRAVYGTYNALPNGYREREADWTDMEYQLRNWFHFLWLSGDHVQEQACHTLDKIAWAMRDVPPLSVTAIGGRQVRTQGNIYDHFCAAFDYPGEVKGFLLSRQMPGCAQDNSDWVWGEKGMAFVNGWEPRHEITGANPWAYEGEGNSMYQQEHDELFASIRAGQPINDGVWMTHSTLLGIMVRMSAYTGQVVTWDEALASTERLGPENYELSSPVPVEPIPVPGETRAEPKAAVQAGIGAPATAGQLGTSEGRGR